MSKKIRIQAELDDSKLRKQLDDIGKRKEKITVDIDSGNIGNADQNMKHLNRTVSGSNSVFGKLKNTISNTFSSGKITLTGYLMVLNEINKAGKNAKQAIQEIDKAVTDLSVATNMSRESVTGLIKDYNTYAKQLSSTTTQITSAADDYLRAGKSMSETQALIQDSIMLSKLGQLESGAATEDLLAVMNGYEMSINEVGKALDAMVAIDMKAATSAGDIATALKYCASSADVAGLSFDKLAAMIATTQEKTMQSAETIGTFMNTILSRYRNVKIGQFVSDDGEDLSEVETILNSLDIKLRDSSQEFRDFEKVIEEVAQSWDSYSSVQQAAIAKAFSGTRQQNRFLALMEGYNKTLELTEVAATSAGTAIDKFNNSYANSLEAKQNTLQAAFESMIMNTDSSEVYGGILDATTALVEFVNQTNMLKGAVNGLAVTGMVKAFLTIKTGIGEAYVVLNKFQQALDIARKSSISTSEYEKLLLLSNGLSASQMKLVLSTNSLTVAQKKALLMASGLSEEEAILQMQTWKMTTANTGLTASTVSLSTALKGLWATMIANPIVMLTTLASATVMAYQTYKQHVVEAAEATKEAIETFESISSEVEALEGKLSELNEQIGKLDPITDVEDIENLQLETEELEKQLAILREKQRISESDADKAAQKSLGMTEASRYKKEERESAYGGVESGAAYVTKDEELQNAIEAYEAYKAKVDEANDALAHMAETGEYTKKEWDEQEKTVSTYSEKMDNARAHANELATSLEEQKQGLSGNTDASQALLTKIDGVITQYDQWLKKINGTTEALEEQAEAEEEVSETSKSISFDQAWADSFTSENEAVKKLGDDLLGLAEKGRLSKRAFEEVDSNAGGYFKNLGISADEAVAKINKLVDETSQLSSMSGEISKISEALRDKRENKFVDADTLSEFDVEIKGLDSWDKFQSVLGSTTSSYQECKDAAETLANEWVNSGNFLPQLTEQNKEYYQTQLESMGVANAEEVVMHQLALAKEEARIATLDLANMTQEAMAGLLGEAESAGITQGEIYRLAAAEIAYNSTGLSTQDKIDQLGNLAKAYGDTATAAIAAAAADRVANGHGDLETIMSDMMAQIGRAAKSYTIDFSGLGKGAKSAGRKAGKDYKDGLQEELSDLNSVISGITSRIDENIDAVRTQKEEAVAAIDAQIDALNEQKSALEDQKKALEEERDARIEVIEQQKKQLELAIKAIDKQIKQKEKVIKGIEAEIKAMKDANEQRKLQLNLQREQYELERLQHQRTILQYSSEKGMHYVTNTKDIRDQKEKVDDAKLEIEIANKQKQIDLIEKEIDLLNEKKEAINEQIDLLDEQIDQINEFYDKQIKAIDKQIEAIDKQIEELQKQKEETEKYYESLIEGLEKSKSKYEELTELVGKAELSAKLKQLGIDEEALVNGSEEEFEKLKNAYMNIVLQLNEGNDEVLNKLRELSGYEGTAPTLLEESNTKLGTMNDELGDANRKVDKVNSSLSETASTTSDIATNVSDANTNISESVGLVNSEKDAFDALKQIIDEVIGAIELKTQAVQEEQNTVATAVESEMANFQLLINKIQEVKEKLDEVNNTVTTMDRLPIDNLANAFQLLYDKVLLVSNLLGVSAEGEGAVSGISGAIQALNEISLEEGIIAQFTNLKTAIDSVTAVISGGGGESSEGATSGGASGSKGGKQGTSGGKGSEGESGGGNSLTGAIEQMGETSKEVIGEPDAEGDGTVIGEFGSMETAVNDVRDAIGTEGGEGQGGGSGSGGETDDTLVGSIEYLGDKTDEEMGESGGDGIIGRFEEFRDVIGEADEHVKSISDGLANIDGKEVSCTIHVNIETSGGTGFTGSAQVLGSMNLDSATYNAQYQGNAHYEGTAEVTGDWGVKKGGTTLVGELGQELIVFPNGRFKTVGDNGAEFVDIPANSIVFNHLQTKELLSKGNIVGRGRALASGTALANGTSNKSDDSIWTTLADGTRVRELQPGDRMYDMMQKFDAYLKSMDGNLEKLVPNSVYEHQRQMADMAKQINYVSNVVNNNRNVQQPVTIQVGDINLTGVQDVNGLAHAIKTRLPNAMLQEMHRR